MSFFKEIEKIFQPAAQDCDDHLDFRRAVEYNRDYAEFLMSELLVKNAALRPKETNKLLAGEFEKLISKDFGLLDDYTALSKFLFHNDLYALRKREQVEDMTAEEEGRHMAAIEKLASLYGEHVQATLRSFLNKDYCDYMGKADAFDAFALWVGFIVLSRNEKSNWSAYAKLNRALMHTAAHVIPLLGQMSSEEKKYANMRQTRAVITTRKEEDEKLYWEAWSDVSLRLKKGAVDQVARIISGKVRNKARASSVRTISRWIKKNRLMASCGHSILTNCQNDKKE